MRVKFISLKEPLKYGYLYDSEAYRTDTRFALSRHFQQCDTLGDVHANGNYTQHSQEWTVQIEFLADYLASLATYILAYPGEETDKLLQHIGYEIMRRPTDEAIAFAASVVFKAVSDTEPWEKRKRWFSLEEKKISSSESKRHDKRYVELEPRHDGKPESIYGILIPSYADGLQFYAYADAIRDWCQAGTGDERPYFYGHTAQFLKWFDGDTQKAQELRLGYKACLEVCRAHAARGEAECMLHNLHWPPEAKTEATDAA